jgi:hypothetical protein
VSNNILAKYPLSPLTLVVLFPSLVYDLQIASIFSLSLLPDLPKTGNHKKGDRKAHPVDLLICALVDARSASTNAQINRKKAQDTTGGLTDQFLRLQRPKD